LLFDEQVLVGYGETGTLTGALQATGNIVLHLALSVRPKAGR
jgi:hypothetical protein